MKALWSVAGLAATMLTAACAASAAAQTRSQPMTPLAAPIASPPVAAGELVPFWLVRPGYPQIARAARAQGRVTVVLTVDPDGRVAAAIIERDVPLLSKAAVDAAKESRFICRGCSGAMTYRLTYAFGLANSIDELDAARANVTLTEALIAVVELEPVQLINGGPAPGSGDRSRGVKCLFLWRCDPPPRRARAGRCLWLWRCGVGYTYA